MAVRWWGKALLQSALASVPYGVQANYTLQRLRGSHSVAKTKERLTWALHFLEWSAPYVKYNDAHIIEIGTGWDGLNPLVLSALGASRITTYDHIPHLSHRMMRQVIETLVPACDRLAAIVGVNPSVIAARIDHWKATSDMAGLLSATNIDYRAPGNPQVSDNSIRGADIFYSSAVLAHIPAEELAGVHATAKTILKPRGRMVHHVGLQDPFNDFNNGDNFKYLSISSSLWKVLFENKIAGNNRLRVNQHVDALVNCGAKIVAEHRGIGKDDRERAKRTKLIQEFQGIPLEELAVTTWDVVAEV